MDRNNRDVRAVVNDPIKPESQSMLRNEEAIKKKKTKATNVKQKAGMQREGGE